MEKITYQMKGDYQIPNLIIPENKIQVNGKYSRMKLNYLKDYKKAMYTTLLMRNELQTYLIEIQKQAEERIENYIIQMKEKEHITEELKQQNPKKWIGLMNNLRNSAEEIVIKELIYA